MATRISSLDELIEVMESAGYDWEVETRTFLPRSNGRGMRMTLSVRQALESEDPEHYLDRSNELRTPPLPPVVWPQWAW